VSNELSELTRELGALSKQISELIVEMRHTTQDHAELKGRVNGHGDRIRTLEVDLAMIKPQMADVADSRKAIRNWLIGAIGSFVIGACMIAYKFGAQ